MAAHHTRQHRAAADLDPDALPEPPVHERDTQLLEDRLGAMPAGPGLVLLAERVPDMPELPQRLGLPALVSDVPVHAQAPLVELDGGAAVPGTMVDLPEVGERRRLAQGILDPIAYPQAPLETVDRLVEAPLVAVGRPRMPSAPPSVTGSPAS